MLIASIIKKLYKSSGVPSKNHEFHIVNNVENQVTPEYLILHFSWFATMTSKESLNENLSNLWEKFH
jgi:hypothetical protein